MQADDSIASQLRVTCARTRVKPIHVHHLRHLSASLLVQGGADVKSVQKRLGRSTLQTTLGIYSHVLSEGNAALAAKMDAALGG